MKILNKRGSNFFIPVFKEIYFSNIEVKSTDSVLRKGENDEDCLNSREDCCIVENNKIVSLIPSKYSCSLSYSLGDCRFIPPETGLFRMIHPTKDYQDPSIIVIQVFFKFIVTFRILILLTFFKSHSL